MIDIGDLWGGMEEEEGEVGKRSTKRGPTICVWWEQNQCLQLHGGILGLIVCMLSCPPVVGGLGAQGLGLETVLIDKNQQNQGPWGAIPLRGGGPKYPPQGGVRDRGPGTYIYIYNYLRVSVGGWRLGVGRSFSRS